MKQVRIIVSFAAVVSLAAPAFSRADPIDHAYSDFKAQRYDRAFSELFDYRVAHEGTLRVDFMLAVSGCHLSSEEARDFGGFLLAAIPNWYSPLRADHRADIARQALACPSTGISEEDAFSAVARSDGKYDANNSKQPHTLNGERSNSGKDQALPPAPIRIPAPSSMGPLVAGQAYLQADYRSAAVSSANACSALCGREERCVAMTFILSQKSCWLKDRVPATAASPDMISALKLHR